MRPVYIAVGVWLVNAFTPSSSQQAFLLFATVVLVCLLILAHSHRQAVRA